MLPFLLLVNAVLARDTPRATNFTVKSVESCPDVGYFFQRELATNSLHHGPCYLCFCQNDGTATCWIRENRRCDLESYHHHGVGRRDTRVRRGVGDIFFRDAARDIFNKRLPEQCKPFESSFSDGCPPVDWCIGCTVCDCDAHGRWDCHILSFCPDTTTKKKPKKRRGPYKRTVIRKSPTSSNTKRTTKVTSKPTSRPKSNSRPKIIKKILKKPVDKRFKRQPATQPKQKAKLRKVIRRRLRSNQKVTKKNVATRKPIQLKNTQMKQIVLPSTSSLNQAVVRQVLAAVQKLLRHDLTKGNASRILKIVGSNPLETHKQVTLKNSKSNNVKSSKITVKHNTKKSGASNKGSKEQKKASRNKRNVNIDENRVEVPTTASIVKENFTHLHAIMEITTEYLIQNDSMKNVTIAPLTTVTDSAYYNNVFDKHTTENDTAMKQLLTNAYTVGFVLVNQSDSKFYLPTEKPANVTIDILSVQENKTMALENVISSIENISNMNDLKFNEWSRVKILKDREKYIKNALAKSTNVIKINNNYKISNDRSPTFKNKFYSRDVKRKVGLSKKFKLKKIINPYEKGRDNKFSTEKSNVLPAIGSIVDLQNMIKNLLNDFNKNNTAKVKPKVKKINVIKYLRKFLNKMFRNNAKKPLKNKQDVSFNKRHVIEVLCDTFGPCKVSPGHKMLLKVKLADLNTETTKILKTINIIKGLLHLIESPKSHNSLNVPLKNYNTNFKDDIQKLNAIIKGTYNEQSPSNLTPTQEIQIAYIKKNTDEFIQSVGKFANLLNEIIAILTTYKTKEKEETEKFYRVLRSSKEDKNYTRDAFKNLKNLLIKYDLIQNTFIRRMYEALSIFESKLNTEKRQKVTMENESKNTASISNLSRNIITNLRKLTKLTQGLNSRRKREVRDENTVEYLLMLMEYLLKQNYPLDAAPVNDGIDLLIEAIKNAPDIKPIKKKVLDYTPVPIIETTSIAVEINNMNDNSLSDSNTIPNEVPNKVETVTSKLDNTKFIEQVEEDRDDDERYIYERKTIETGTEININITEKDEVVQFKPVSVAVADERINEVNKDDVKESMGKYKGTDGDVEGGRRYEVFNADMDDDVIGTSTTSTFTGTMDTITTPIEATTETVTKFNFFKDDSSQSGGADRKAKLDWIEENYAEEIKDFKDSNAKNAATPSITLIVKQMETTSKPIEENESSITKELKDENKKKSKIEVDEVMFEKQMDLLNSLDYGTEKTEFDTESKYVISDDRYSGDAFPPYFI